MRAEDLCLSPSGRQWYGRLSVSETAGLTGSDTVLNAVGDVDATMSECRPPRREVCESELQAGIVTATERELG